jgi:hypothetical protein
MQARRRFLRSPRLAVALLAVGLQGACAKCGDSEPHGTEARGTEGSASSAVSEGKAEAQTAVTIQPKLGGSVLAVGEAQVEVAVYENGSVKGLVFDSLGKPLSDRAAVDFAVTLQAANGSTPKVDLTWNDACACFAGQAELEGALAVRPIDVSLNLDGSSDVAKLESYVLLPAPQLAAEANVTASARAAVPQPPRVDAKLAAGSSAKGLAELKTPKVDLNAGSGSGASASASAKANVSVPKPAVQLKVGTSTSSTSTKSKEKAGASVKAGASFGFGTK